MNELDIDKLINDVEDVIRKISDNHKHHHHFHDPRNTRNPEWMDDAISKTLQWLVETYPEITNTEQNDVLLYIEENYPVQYFQIRSRELAFLLDEQYQNNIRNLKKVFLIDDITGKPFAVVRSSYSKKDWDNLFNNCACFRNLVDLIVAKKVLKTFKKRVWTNKPNKS
jgi:hypothetical protein